jgi:hypothetical protein
MKTRRNIIIVGDRVLIEQDEGSGKIAASLYLPPMVKEKVQAGCVVKTARANAILLKGPAMESGFEEKKYRIVLRAAISALVLTELAGEGRAA